MWHFIWALAWRATILLWLAALGFAYIHVTTASAALTAVLWVGMASVVTSVVAFIASLAMDR